MRSFLWLAVLIGWVCPFPTKAAEHSASDAKALRSLEKIAKPGDVIVLLPGTWKDQGLKIRLRGTAEAPIILRAPSFGSVVLTGGSFLDLEGDWVTVENLVFSGGSPEEDSVIRLAGQHCRLTQCGIFYYNPEKPSTRYFWVSLYGHHHRVDHSAFAGQNHSGVTLVAWLNPESESGSHQIDHNYFGLRSQGKGNGFETIRLGDSKTSMINARCVVEDNLFEECDGEIEIISNKSCENIFRRNTFLRNAGCLTLRHGNRCAVEENVILGEGKKGTGGIRVVGEGHVIARNHIEGTEGRAEAAISLSAANADAEPHEHQLVRDVRIEGNVVVDNKGSCLGFDHGLGDEGMTLLPVDITITDNIFVTRGEDSAIGERGSGAAFWKGNVVKAANLGIPGREGLRRVEEMAAIPARPRSLTRQDVGPKADWMGLLKNG